MARSRPDGLVSLDRNKVLESAQKYLAKGQLDKAIAELQRIVAADPTDVRTLLKIAELEAKKGSTKDSVDTYVRVGDTYAEQGFFTKSVAVYKQASKLDPSRLDVLAKLARNYEDLQHGADALATYDQLSMGHLAANQIEPALAAMKRSTEIEPQNLSMRIRFAEALSKANRPREAADFFEQGAQLVKQQGRMDDYIKVAERLLFHRGNDLVVAKELAELYLQRNDGKRALAKLQVLFKANPKDADVLSLLADAFVSLGQKDKAIQVLKELGKIYYELKRMDDRTRTLRRIVELDPSDPDARTMLVGANRPRIDVDAVVPASAVIGGGGRSGASPGRPMATAGGGPFVPIPGARGQGPVVPSPGRGSVLSPANPALASGNPQAANARALPPSPPAAAPVMTTLEVRSLAAPLPHAPVLEPSTEERNLGEVAGADDIGIEIEVETDSLLDEPSSPSIEIPRAEDLDEAGREALVTRLLAECEVFARYGLKPRVLAQLERIVDLAPTHIRAREKLRDAYLDDERSDDAVEQMLAIADLVKETDRVFALSQLRQAMLFDDENPDVRRMIRAIDPSALPSRMRASRAPSGDAVARGSTPPDDDGVMFVDEDDTSADEVMFVDDGTIADGEVAQDAEQAPPRADDVPTSPPAAIEEPAVTLPPPKRSLPPTEERLLSAEESAQLPAVLAFGDDEEAELEAAPSTVPPSSSSDAALQEARAIASGTSLLDTLLDRRSLPELEAITADDVEDLTESVEQAVAMDSLLPPIPEETIATPRLRPPAPALPRTPPPLPARPPLRPPPPAPSTAKARPASIPAPSERMSLPAIDDLDFDEPTSPEDLEQAPSVATVSVAPVSVAPVSVAPVSVAPIARKSLPPLSAPPESLAPVSLPPLSIAPASIAPASVRPPSIAPASVRPASIAPASVRPASIAPASIAPASIAPESARPASIAPESVRPASIAPESVRPASIAPESVRPVSVAPVSVAPAPTPRRSLVPGPPTEEILEEADFYLAQGLFEEARAMLRDAIESHPNHPLFIEKLAEVEDLARAGTATSADIVAGAFGALEHEPAPLLETPMARSTPEPLPLDEESVPPAQSAFAIIAAAVEQAVTGTEEPDVGAFALAEKLAESLDEELGPAAGSSLGADSIDVDQVFQQFKRGVEQQVDESDTETHYDLGIAYKEMGLLDDAIGEFEIASRSPVRASIALTMIGLCRVEQGRVDEGIAALERGLAAPHRDAREELGLRFELAVALTVAGRDAEALANFERVRAGEPTFRGVNERIAALRVRLGSNDDAERREQEELERAFEDLLGG